MAKRSDLPFEPKKKKGATKSAKAPAAAAVRSNAPKSPTQPAKKSTGIPEIVSQRMVARMAIFCGTPTLLGLMTFPLSYFIVHEGWFKLPNVAVVIASLGLFGLGALGLSYGILSASWDEHEQGSWLGWQEFRTNFGRVVESWQAYQAQRSQKAE
ncbi:PAM68 family protein [Thermosynechococcus sichuanensis E542]|uniref:PAM68 family protein n=1 Tax=Thermosynechococcus sichuanensis E542 TaxID=2016101 RepID=A0A3B7MI23_9CYAN|nr:PAM68 family protein [Thermosynechococcus vestitus]AXY67530.1 PAM68 family protein [Thermosynechococcus vestitus E542]